MSNDKNLAQRKDLIQLNLTHWEDVCKTLFGGQTPLTKEWTSLPEIIQILNLVGVNNRNHTLHPNSGGLDLSGCASSKEHGCIELFLIGPNCPEIVKPQKLTFNSFPGVPEWTYFLLETGGIRPSGVYPNLRPECISEPLTELPDGQYISISNWDGNEYFGNPLPEGSRSVERIFSGSFAIFQKTSPYNGIRTKNFNAYNAVHNTKSPTEFRKFCHEGAKTVPSMIQNI